MSYDEPPPLPPEGDYQPPPPEEHQFGGEPPSKPLAPVATGSGQVATWAVLFTDMVGSTEFRVRVGEVEFDRVRADLDRRIARAITRNDGVAVKSTGDGVLAGFAATASALRCATAIQDAVAERNRDAGDELALRVAISVGDAVAEDGDLQGTAVVEAARLCAVAAPGTILCSGAVRSVSANRSGCSFGEPRSVTLKGLPMPVVVHEVIPERPAEREVGRGLSFRVLGPLRVERDSAEVAVGGPKEQLVLAILLARAGTSVSLSSIVDTVWDERPPRTAERTIHAYVARLRRALEPKVGPDGTRAVIETVGRGYRLSVEPEQIDAGRFERLTGTGSDLLAGGDPAAAATLFRDALAEWRGDAYAGLPDVGPCAAEAARLEGLRLGAVEDRVDADLAAGEAASLVPELEAAVGEQPFRERRWAQLMVALYRSGRQREALDAYQRARRVLVDELGIEPGPELRRLEAAILDQDASLDFVTGDSASGGPGGLPLALAAIGPAFVGREGELSRLRSAWEAAARGDGGFVTILGVEGAGKTRLVAEVARGVHDDGAGVFYGRCDHALRGARALVDEVLRSAGGAFAPAGAIEEGPDLGSTLVRQLTNWADGRPLMVVLDDLHVADAETLEFVADLAVWCRATRLLVVGVFRQAGGTVTDRDDGTAGNRSQLVLGPLADGDVAKICRIYGEDDWTAEDVARVAELSEGVPLLVHDNASALARDRAERRVEQAAGRLAASRGRLVTSRDEVTEGVEAIQRLLEQRRTQLAGREALHLARNVAALAGCPYKGLARFEASDADNFFGRERLVAELVARVSEAAMVAVVGPSGSGKSSLLRAGLLPALAAGVLAGGDPWRTVVLCPGARPTQELAARLRDVPPGATPRVVLVDQFEEIFTLGARPGEQVEFVDHLLALSHEPATAVVLAVRADHLGRCAAHPDLAAQLAGNDVLVGPMRDTELRRTVELPAHRAGLEIESGLAEVIVGDVAGRAGALPLLSTALAETWERREGRRLTLVGYRAAGGVNGALARLAEEGYAAIPAAARPAARRILLRLCDTGEDAALDVRRRLPLADVVDENDSNGRAALDKLADRRLLTVDGDTVEVAHESLLREWPRLRAWLEDDVDGRRVHRRLGDAARAWDADERDASVLYRGTQLQGAADWAEGHADALNRTERAFLEASQEAAAGELAEAERRAADRARANRRLRAQLVALGIALVVTLVVGVVAVRQRDMATRERRVATARELAAAANANLGVDPERSVLLALAAVDRSRAGDGGVLPEAEQALHDAVSASRAVLHVPGVGGAVAWSPDGTQFAAADAEGAVVVHDATSGEQVQVITGHDERVNGVAFSPDGGLLGTTSEDGYARVWDLETGDELHSLESPAGRDALAPAFSPDGSLFAAAWWNEGLVRILDLTRGRIVREVVTECCPRTAAFDPSGGRILVASLGRSVVLDVRSGDEVLDLGEREVRSAAWSPDGLSIATADADGSARVLDARTGRERFMLLGHRARVNEVAWSADSSRIVTAGDDGTAKVWAISGDRGRELLTLTAQDTRAGIVDAAFSPDGSRVVTGDIENRATIVWQVSRGGSAELANLPAVMLTPTSPVPVADSVAAFTPDGRAILAGNAAGGVTVWNAETFTSVRTLGPQPPAFEPLPNGDFVDPPAATNYQVNALEVSPDGRLVAAATLDWNQAPVSGSELRIWDIETGREAFRAVHRGVVDDLAWSPDGQLLALSTSDFAYDEAGEIASAQGWLAVVDHSGREIAARPDQDVGVHINSIAFTADGKRIVGSRSPMASFDTDFGEVVTWDWTSGRLERRIDTGSPEAVLSPRADLIVSTPENFLGGSQDTEVWDWPSGRHRRTLVGNSGSVIRGVFSPDGSRLATASKDGAVWIWNPYTGEPQLVLRGHLGAVTSIAFSPDGSRLASASVDGTVRVWALDLDELVDVAERGLTRTLTDDECRQYLHTEKCQRT